MCVISNSGHKMSIRGEGKDNFNHCHESITETIIHVNDLEIF